MQANGAEPVLAQLREACEPHEEETNPVRRLAVIQTGGEQVEPRVRGERWLRLGEATFQWLDAIIQRVLPAERNPLAQSGAIANTTLLIACISGVLLLFWYQTSVHHAYSSVRATELAFLPRLVRSVHRYSSDACLAFVVLHALKLFFARRFGGARWLAWVSGLFLIATLWVVGWLGYWLVWDERAQAVALGSARMLDKLPIFADPLSRSFLTDGGLNSLLFFVVFFVHMLVPLAMGIALWIHIKRLSRPEFLTKRVMTAWVLGALVVVSLVAPADVAGPAKMAQRPAHFALDYWFLSPVALTDRLTSGAIWGLALTVGIVLFSIPWLLATGRARAAAVLPARCTSCNKCYEDCPYDAIDMVARDDGRPYPKVAIVDPAKCLGCGICAGSCDSAGVGIGWFDAIAQRRQIDHLVESSAAKAAGRALALVCAESAGCEIEIDANGVSAALPGYLAVRVPCAGWVHPLLVERARRRGASHVLIAACGEGSCRFREGGKWTEQRVAGTREPKLRVDRVGADRVRVVSLFRHQRAELTRAAAELLASVSATATRYRAGRFVVGLGLAASLGAALWLPSRAGYAAPASQRGALVVSFKHPGSAASVCRELTSEEKNKLPPYMRPKQVCERRRADVRLRISVDGREILRRSYAPRGLWGDGNSIAIEELPIPAGFHAVRVELGDTPNPDEYGHVSEQTVSFETARRSVVVFDKLSGFRWES